MNLNNTGTIQIELRKKILAMRQSTPTTELDRLSTVITARFINFALSELHTAAILPRPPRSVGLYRALFGEVNLTTLIDKFNALGWNLYFPRIKSRDDKVLEFVHVRQTQNPENWKKGALGILEPAPELPAASLQELDMIFVPGVAFGPEGERVGMGAGYYDRILAQMPQALRMSLAFDFQISDKIVQNPWDQSVHWIFTQTQEFRTSFVKKWCTA